MDEDRLKRYYDKKRILNENIKYFEKWTRDISAKKFKDNLEVQIKYSIYYAFQISVETMTDIVAMIVKDIEIIPKDDYSNIDILKDKEILNPELAAHLREANGMRNRIVHEYNGMDEVIAYNSLKKLIKHLQEFKEVIQNWLKMIS